MKTVGIIGGSSTVATIEYYKLINAGIRSHLGGLSSGEIIINSMNFGEADRIIANDLWDEGAVYLNGKARSLQRAGADFIILVANTWHKIAEEIMQDVQLPLLHIVDPTGAEIQRLGLKKVALLGTKATMAMPFLADRYRSQYELEVLVPPAVEQDEINRVIFQELSQANFRPESKAKYLNIIDALVAEGAQGVIMGCTEIGLLVQQTDRPSVPMLDSMVLHAQAVVKHMLA